MCSQDLKPIQKSNDYEKSTMAYIICGFFSLIALGSIGLGCYLASFHNDWWVMLLFGPIAMIMGFFAYAFYPSEKNDIYSYELRNNELYQEWFNKKTKQKREEIIPFSKIKQVLIGLYADTIPSTHKSFYRFNALLIIRHDNGYFFERFLVADELQEWIKRLSGKVPDIKYTDNDLSEAIRARYYTEVDFSRIDGDSVDIVSNYIGKETYQKILTIWLPEEIKMNIQQAKMTIDRSATRKGEKRTLWIVCMYNLLFATFVLPYVPFDTDGLIEMSDAILLGYIGVNLIIPCLFVFWRRFLKWFYPILLFIASIIGNLVGVSISMLIKDTSYIYESIIPLNLFNLLLWICALIVIKVFKFVAHSKSKYMF